MSRYFCLCPGGVKSDSDASVHVDSFSEIRYMLNTFAENIPHKFVKYKTQFIMDKSPEKFPHWGCIYMVIGITKDGQNWPLGYCNFKKTFFSSISPYAFSLVMMFVLAIAIAILNIIRLHFDTALWCAIAAMLTACIGLLRLNAIRLKLSYLLK